MSKNVAPKSASRPLVLNKWTLSSDPENDGKRFRDEYGIREIYFHPDGDKLVVASRRAVQCLDLNSGKILASIQPESVKGQTLHYESAVSPDGRFAAVPHQNAKEVEIRETATGRLVGTYRLDDKSRFPFHTGQLTFSPAGNALVALADRNGPQLHLVSTRTGTGRPLSAPALTKDDVFADLLFAADQGALIGHRGLVSRRKGPSSYVSAFDLKSGKETPLTSVTVRPHSFDHDRPWKLSPDGSLLLVKGDKEMQISDWQADRRVFEFKGDTYQDPTFTPDGKRFLVCWHDVRHGSPNYIVFDSRPVRNGMIELFSIKRMERIATFTPQDNGFPHGPTALAVSADGRTVAVATERTVALLDFQGAFGVAPIKMGEAAPAH